MTNPVGSTYDTTHYVCVLLRRKPHSAPVPPHELWVEGTTGKLPWIEERSSRAAAERFVAGFSPESYNNTMWERADYRIDTDEARLHDWATERWELLNALES